MNINISYRGTYDMITPLSPQLLLTLSFNLLFLNFSNKLFGRFEVLLHLFDTDI